MTGRLFIFVLCTVCTVLPFDSSAFQTFPMRRITSSERSHSLSVIHNSFARTARIPLASISLSQLASTARKEQDNEALPVDYDALVKYHAAIAIQMTIFAGLLTGLDTLLDATGINLPFPAVAALFYGLSLKSRAFNPLNNARPSCLLKRMPTTIPVLAFVIVPCPLGLLLALSFQSCGS